MLHFSSKFLLLILSSNNTAVCYKDKNCFLLLFCAKIVTKNNPYLSHYWSAHDFWKIKFEKSSKMNLIFCLFRTWILKAAQAVEVKFEIENKSSSSNFVFQTWSSADQWGIRFYSVGADKFTPFYWKSIHLISIQLQKCLLKKIGLWLRALKANVSQENRVMS